MIIQSVAILFIRKGESRELHDFETTSDGYRYHFTRGSTQMTIISRQDHSSFETDKSLFPKKLFYVSNFPTMYRLNIISWKVWDETFNIIGYSSFLSLWSSVYSLRLYFSLSEEYLSKIWNLWTKCPRSETREFCSVSPLNRIGKQFCSVCIIWYILVPYL